MELPFPVVQRTYLASFEPARDAVEVESMLEDKVQIRSHNFRMCECISSGKLPLKASKENSKSLQAKVGTTDQSIS